MDFRSLPSTPVHAHSAWRGSRMSVCVIANTAVRAVGLVGCTVAILDIFRRKIPSYIAKFRALVMLYLVLGTVQSAIFDDRNDVIRTVDGTLNLLRHAVLWLAALYFLENFVSVFLALDSGGTVNLSELSLTVACWSYARVILFALLAILAFIFPFDLSNRIQVARLSVGLICMVLVLLPLCIVMLRLAFSLTKYYSQLADEPSEDDPEGHASRCRTIKRSQLQLKVFACVLIIACGVGVYSFTKDLIELSRDLDSTWMTECNDGYGIASTVAILLALALTLSRNSQQRIQTTAVRTRATSTSTTSGNRRSSPELAPTKGDAQTQIHLANIATPENKANNGVILKKTDTKSETEV